MVLQSGIPPYEYAIGKGSFRVPEPYSARPAIGPSGILLEQAQFIITAEMRKFRRLVSSHILSDFFVYINPAIAPSGPYEPKANGSTLGNEVAPASLSYIDVIQDTRSALESLFNFYTNDSDYSNEDFLKGWFQSAYPDSPSGFYFAPEFFTTGHNAHRFPSEVGIIDYNVTDVLGSSGVLYDIDFGEVMFNPAPFFSRSDYRTAHGRRGDTNANDTFMVLCAPIFPSFQKTDGSLVPLTGREPVLLSGNEFYATDPIFSGVVRFDGYALREQTSIALGHGIKFNTDDFDFFMDSIRSLSLGGNAETTRIFSTPRSQGSGVYRVAGINRFANFSFTTIESGIFSYWPTPAAAWPSDSIITNTNSNIGYQVFDDTLWMTDRNTQASYAGSNFGYPSGLALLSPFTFTSLWVRYADQTPIASQVTFGAFPVSDSGNWSTFVGLTRPSPNNIYRLHPTTQRPFASNSGQLRLGRYNDVLDLSAAITSTSDVTQPNIANQFPVNDGAFFFDLWHDPIADEYWVSNGNTPGNGGFPYWKFDSTFKYLNKYVPLVSSGLVQDRGVNIGGKQYVFYGGQNGTDIGSGLIPMDVVTDGTDPFSDDGSAPSCGTVQFGMVKYINGAPFIGHATSAQIMDVIEISGATHLRDGIYAIIAWVKSGIKSLYIIRIEESTNYWEVKSIARIDTSVGAAMPARELVFIPY